MPSLTYTIPFTPQNIVWSGPHDNFSPDELATAGNQSKLLYLDSNGDLQWVSFSDTQIAEIEQYATYASLPAGSTTKLYFVQDTAEWYRWTGSVYVHINAEFLRHDGTVSMSGNLNLNSNNITNGGTVTATTGTFTNLSACTLQGAITGNSQNATGLNTVSGTTGTFTNLSATTLQGAITGNSQNATGLGTVSGTTGTFTNLSATTLQGAITGNSQNATGLGTVSGTTGTFTNLSATTLQGDITGNNKVCSGCDTVSATHLVGTTDIKIGGNFVADYSITLFTPTMWDLVTGATITATDRCYKLKCGKIYLLFYYIQWSSKNSASGTVYINMPSLTGYSGGSGYFRSSGSIAYHNGITYPTGYTSITPWVAGNQSNFTLNCHGSGVASSPLQFSDLGDSGEIEMFCIVYVD